MARPCSPLCPTSPTLSGLRAAMARKGLRVARWHLPRILSPPYLREGSERPQEQQTKHSTEGAHHGPGPGPGRRTGLAARAHQLSLGSALHPRVVPETSSRASAGGPRRPSAHLVGPNRTLRSHFKRGRSFSEVSALTFPFHHHPRHTRYPVPVSRNAAT